MPIILANCSLRANLSRKMSMQVLLRLPYSRPVQSTLCQRTLSSRAPRIKTTREFSAASSTRVPWCRVMARMALKAAMVPLNSRAATTFRYLMNVNSKSLDVLSVLKAQTWRESFLNVQRTCPRQLRLSSWDFEAKAQVSKKDPNRKNRKSLYISALAPASTHNTC